MAGLVVGKALNVWNGKTEPKSQLSLSQKNQNLSLAQHLAIFCWPKICQPASGHIAHPVPGTNTALWPKNLEHSPGVWVHSFPMGGRFGTTQTIGDTMGRQ